ncbi:hypothetical protein C8R45DRAFT_978626 [Mycena sanguinolenta]|nr:hypothetical protein C8R45DRAFT_978626 [Mycena sanguinolenta]
MSAAGYSFDVGELTTPLFAGTLLNWTLLGALAVQIYLYFIAFPKDALRFKLLILFVFVAEILQTMSDTRNTFRVFGPGWGNFSLLDQVGWSWFSVPVIGSTIACLGQIFFAWRIYIISRSLIIPALVTIIAFFQLGAGLWTGVEIAQAGTFSAIQYNYFKAPIAWLSATAACDLIVVASTCFYLLKSRAGLGFHRSTDNMVFRIIKVTVETGLICALWAITDLVLYIVYQGNNNHLIVCIPLSKAYSNSIMVILNSRAHIGHEITTQINSTGHQMSVSSEVRFKRSAGPTVSTTVQTFPSHAGKYDESIHDGNAV